MSKNIKKARGRFGEKGRAFGSDSDDEPAPRPAATKLPPAAAAGGKGAGGKAGGAAAREREFRQAKLNEESQIRQQVRGIRDRLTLGLQTLQAVALGNKAFAAEHVQDLAPLCLPLMSSSIVGASPNSTLEFLTAAACTQMMRDIWLPQGLSPYYWLLIIWSLYQFPVAAHCSQAAVVQFKRLKLQQICTFVSELKRFPVISLTLSYSLCSCTFKTLHSRYHQPDNNTFNQPCRRCGVRRRAQPVRLPAGCFGPQRPGIDRQSAPSCADSAGQAEPRGAGGQAGCAERGEGAVAGAYGGF